MIDYRLVRVSNCYTDMYFVEQVHEPYSVTYLGHDLTDEEEEDLIKKFEKGDLNDKLYSAVWFAPEYVYQKDYKRADLGIF